MHQLFCLATPHIAANTCTGLRKVTDANFISSGVCCVQNSANHKTQHRSGLMCCGHIGDGNTGITAGGGPLNIQ